MTVADRLVHHLVAAGTRTIFGMPGGGSLLDIIDAAGRLGLRFVLAHTETAGALMACAQAELSGRPGACLATLGPGAASLANGVAHAFLDRVPLVVLTDSLADADAARYSHQNLDQRALFSAIARYSGRLSSADPDETISAALRAAAGPPPGPSHLECSPDVSGAACPAPTLSGTDSDRPPQGSVDIGMAADLLRGAARPVIIAGLGAANPAAAAAVRRFSGDRGVPVLVTYKAKGVIQDEDALFAGVFTNGAIERPLVLRADLILGVGLDPVELIPRPWRYAQPSVLCSAWPLHQRHIQPAIEIVGDVADILGDLQGAATRSAWSADDLTPLVAAQRDAVRRPAAGLAPHVVVDVVAQASGEYRPRITIDAGAHMFPATVLWPAREPRDVLISNGLSTMGFALPSAIGAALLEPERTVVAFTGDAGLLMCLAELGTAARERLKVVVVVFNDRALSLIKIKQVEKAYASSGVDLGFVDWPVIAQGLGVPSRRARTEPELARAVQEAMDATGPFLIDVIVDPGGYGEMLRAIRG